MTKSIWRKKKVWDNKKSENRDNIVFFTFLERKKNIVRRSKMTMRIFE